MTAQYQSGTLDERGDALEQGYRAVLSREGWVTDDVFRAAVVDVLGREEWMPKPVRFLDYCTEAVRRVKQAATRAALAALPPPPDTWHVMEGAASPDELDETDPYACTAEERVRWAREDAWIRQYAKHVSKEPPIGADARALQSWRSDVSVTLWPALTPQQRRAKERRIERERQEAMAALGARFGREAAALAASIPARPEPGR